MQGAVIDLGGRWQLREAIGETWRWYARAAGSARNSVAVDAAQPGRWSPATVPGSVIDALWQDGQIPDPRRGFGSRAAEWTATRHWVLAREVDIPEDWVGAELTMAVDGIDPGGRVLVDGAEVAHLDGLYDTARVPLRFTDAGPHALVVVIDPVPPGVPQVGRTADVRRHAPRLGNGWDFCPPFPHQGIWRPIRLVRGPAPLDITLHTGCGAEGDGWVAVGIAADAADGTTAELTVGGDACAAVSVTAVVQGGAARARIPVHEVRRWWPRGMGPQPLATVRVRIGDVSVVRRIGFRTIAWVRTPSSPPDALPYGLLVNEVPVPLCGANWAPADAQLASITPDRLTHLLDLAVAAGVRLLRIWGGGIVETDELYDACDARGLLVWQEFSQSSSGLQSTPSDDPDFLEQLERDARTLVPARAHHPSLVLWGGGNELEDDDGPLATDRSAALQRLAAVVAELDPERGWLPTSPSGGAFHHRLNEIERDPEAQHDVHGPWEYQGLTEQHTLANAGVALAHTEFGVEGAANERLHAHLVPAELAWPADRTSAIYRHLGEWWDNADQVSEVFGGIADLPTLRRASQWLQTIGLAVATEADRRRWPRTSMVLPWQLAESYPNAWCTALVDFLGEPKPALAALARAFADERVSLRAETTSWAGRARAHVQAWVWSLPSGPSGRASGREAGGQVMLSALDLAGASIDSAATALPAVTNPTPMLDLSIPTPPGVFIWHARWTDRDGTLIDDDRVLHTGATDLRELFDLPATTLATTATPEGWTVRNTGRVSAVGLAVHDRRPATDARPLAALGDPRPLLPGEETVIRLASGAALDGDLVVDAFNVTEIALGATP